MNFSIFSNKGERKITIPDTWETLPTSKYQQLSGEWDRKDMVKAFSIISGIPFKNLFDTKDPELEAQLTLATSFLFSQPPTFKGKKSDYFRYDDRKFKVKDISLSIGQSIHVRQKLDTCKTYDEAISYALAIAIQPQIDEEFDIEKVEHLERVIGEMPITQTYGAGFFLLKPLMKLGRITTSKWSLLTILLFRALSRKEKISQLWQRWEDWSRSAT